jgi:decaprenyl-phosphate phosphoribosyltransferase
MHSTVTMPTLGAHLQIARFDHWVKNVFVLPGLIAALSVTDHVDFQTLAWKFVVGMLAIGLVASSNYVINEVLDAPFDRLHPLKKQRPVPAGLVSIPLAYVQWIVMMLAGLGLAWLVSERFTLTLGALWIMGCIYNIPPIRSKDKPYLDVLSESVNNPLRLMAGWFMVTSATFPPASLLMSYWMIGSYFMAIKRWAELRDIQGKCNPAEYRASFAYYTSDNLLISIIFYGSSAMLFLGSFTIRYRIEWILAYPLVALVMAVYMKIGFKEDSAAQAPEKLYKEPLLMVSVIACAAALGILLFVDIPVLYEIFDPAISGLRSKIRT